MTAQLRDRTHSAWWANWAFAPWLTLALFLAPVLAGLAGTLAPAFGYLPALGGNEFSLAPWMAMWRQPGIGVSIALSVQVGVIATLAALLLATAFMASAGTRGVLQRLMRLVPPLLATPHVAVAIGLAFLIAPSGWLARAISPALTGWDRPPTGFVTVNDPYGLVMALGLVLKELPYLLLMMAAALQQVPHATLMRTGQAMGYRASVAWLKLVFPLIYRQLRLPVYAVLAFSMSNVEVGLILAPGNPPPLAIQATRWFMDYDLQRVFPASAAAVLQGLLVLIALGCWRLGEVLFGRLGQWWCKRGVRSGVALPAMQFGAGAGALALMTGVIALLGMGVWSVTQSWRFPDALPHAFTSATWIAQTPRLAQTFVTTLTLALATSLLSVALVVACLEAASRYRNPSGSDGGRGPESTLGSRLLRWVYLPLMVPQIAFLYGFQVLLVRLRIDGEWLGVAWAHLVFVLPYVFLSLSDPWSALDVRLPRTAAALGASPWRVLCCVRMPLLLKPMLLAFAIGCGVSVGLYLPTLFAGAGRIATLTTEAVTLASGADRRITGVFAVLQSALPLLLYAAGLLLPALVYRNRRGMA
jgi:putative thiamine transport system permease protein